MSTAMVLNWLSCKKLSCPENDLDNSPKRSPLISSIESSLRYSKSLNEREICSSKFRKKLGDELVLCIFE